MPEKNCIQNPESVCYGLLKAQELEDELDDFRKQNSDSHSRMFNRLEKLEKQEGIQGEQYKNIMEKLGSLTENLSEMKRDSKEIISKIPALTSRVEILEKMAADVDELKSKPGKRWESIVQQAIGIIVAAAIGFMLARIGLS